MSRTRDHRGISSGSEAYFDVSDFCVIRFYNFLANDSRPALSSSSGEPRCERRILVRELVFRRVTGLQSATAGNRKLAT